MLGMFLVDRGANDMLMLESRFIFLAARFQVADQIAHGCFG